MMEEGLELKSNQEEPLMEEETGDNEPALKEVLCEQDLSDPFIEISAKMSQLLPELKLSDPLSTKEGMATCIWDLSNPPLQITGAWMEYEKTPKNFTKGCKWSPDGSCILTNSDDHILRLLNLPLELYSSNTNMRTNWSKLSEMISAVDVQESDLVYDYCWYPLMSSTDPITCCFLSTSKNQPVHLWDAFDGALRSSYRAYDHLDEIVAAHSLALDPFGQHLYCGYNKTIRAFDLALPGREFREFSTKEKGEGQSGIISAISVNPANHRILAAGSYSKTVGLYLEPRGDRLCLLTGLIGGVTHLLFSPDGNRLFSGGRKDPEIICWDIRNPGEILCILHRSIGTNQRIYFDINNDGSYLISGNGNGVVTFWDLNEKLQQIPDQTDPILQPKIFFKGHSDCVNGASFHPSLPIVATSSGQRHIPDPIAKMSDEPLEVPEEDNSLRLWWCQGNPLINSLDTNTLENLI